MHNVPCDPLIYPPQVAPLCTSYLTCLARMLVEILLGILALFLILYRYVTKNFGKWEALGIPYAKGSFPFGSYNFLAGDSIDTQDARLSKQFQSERYFGTFLFGKPSLNINDPDLLRLIQVKDFDHFVDRNSASDNKKFFSGGELDQVRSQILIIVKINLDFTPRSGSTC